jgi:5-methylcytosine-specific restriction enzyme subunit McrC
MQAGGNVQAQWTGSLDDQARVPIRPDLTWWAGRHCRAVADVKYKLASDGTSNSDIYQMLAYCIALDLPRGYLICAAGEDEPSSYAIRNAGIEIVVKALDLAAEPARLLEQAEDLRLAIESGSLLFSGDGTTARR